MSVFLVTDLKGVSLLTLTLVHRYHLEMVVTLNHLMVVLQPAAASAPAGGGNITINLTLDGQKLSEVVIDNLGRQLNQSGQILR